MTYTVERLAPGSYDVLLDGVVIAALVRVVSGTEPSDAWQIELLDEVPQADRPAPFTSQGHTFRSRAAALASRNKANHPALRQRVGKLQQLYRDAYSGDRVLSTIAMNVLNDALIHLR